MGDQSAIAALAISEHDPDADWSLPGWLYTDPENHAREVERVIRPSWQIVCHESDLAQPGDYRTLDYIGESVIAVRGEDGAIRAFANVCRHRGSRICLEPVGRANVLVCPYHAWSYELDGRLRAARNMGDGFDKARHGLKPVALEVAEGLVFLSLADRPLAFDGARRAIAEAYGPYGWEGAKVALRETYKVEANWKLAVENYLECYHCTPAHPEYSKLHALEKPLAEIEGMNAAMEARTMALGLRVGSIDRRVGSETGEPSVFIFRYALYDGVATGAAEGKPVAPLMGGFTAYDGGVTSAHFAPSSFFIAYPDHGVIYRFLPKTAGTSEMELIWLVKGDAEPGRDYDPEALAWLWRVTSVADKRITEDNQRGVNSRYYEPGPYAPVEPNAIRWMEWYRGEIARA